MVLVRYIIFYEKIFPYNIAPTSEDPNSVPCIPHGIDFSTDDYHLVISTETQQPFLYRLGSTSIPTSPLDIVLPLAETMPSHSPNKTQLPGPLNASHTSLPDSIPQPTAPLFNNNSQPIASQPPPRTSG